MTPLVFLIAHLSFSMLLKSKPFLLDYDWCVFQHPSYAALVVYDHRNDRMSLIADHAISLTSPLVQQRYNFKNGARSPLPGAPIILTHGVHGLRLYGVGLYLSWKSVLGKAQALFSG
jgi:hypothetical protein